MDSGDSYIVNSSMAKHEKEFIFEKKEMIYTIDSNNGSYGNGVVHFDLASLSNCGRPVDFRNSTLVIPYVVRMSGAITDNSVNAFGVSLKNHIHTIDSMTVQVSNHNVVEPQEFSNIPCSFKLLTEMSRQELEQYGYSIGFQKDNALSLRSSTADARFAPNTYEYNNLNTEVLTAPATGNTYGNQTTLSAFSCNDAHMKRMLDSSYDITSLDAVVKPSIEASGKSHCVRSAGSAVWQGLITLPLRFLNDFFDKMPLVRNSYVKMSITTNLQSRSTIACSAGGNYTGLAHALSAKCVPYMISPTLQGVVSSGAGDIIVESGIGRLVSDANTFNKIFTACRLYSPVYTLSPLFEDTYFNQPPKTIHYSSYFRAVTPSLAHGNSLNSFLVSNALTRIRSVLVFPVASSQNNMLSPFSSCPTTCMSYAFMNNFNVKIGGSNHYQEGQVYSWEHFREEISKRGVNGNMELGLGSGLINELEWNAGYRFLYVDLRKKASQAQDDMAKSVYLEGTNISGVAVTYHVFVEYEKQITINMSTGQLVTI
jgi:hypothetical protein